MPTPAPDPKLDEIRFHLHRTLAHEQPARYGKDFVHASEVTKEDPQFCPREWAFYDITGKRPRGELVTTSQAATFRLGHIIQAEVTDWAVRAGIAVGDWECSVCRYLQPMSKKPKRGCSSCRDWSDIPNEALDWRFKEPRFISGISGASGGIDLLVDLPGREKLLAVEIKTMMKEDFLRLQMPKGEHRTRTCLYLRIIAESTDPASTMVDTEEARILYIVKGGWGQRGSSDWGLMDGPWSPFKEFRVYRNDETTQPYHEKAKELADFRRDGVMPCGICPTQFHPRAKFCPVVNECFSGEMPPGLKLEDL